MEIHLSNRVRAWFKVEGGTEKGTEVNQQPSDVKICKNGGSEVERTEESKHTRGRDARSGVYIPHSSKWEMTWMLKTIPSSAYSFKGE